MRSHFNLLLVGAMLVGALILAGQGAAATGHAAVANPSRCLTKQLTIGPVGGSAGVGHVGVEFRLRNHSATSCTLYGYPGAQLLDARQRPLYTTVYWGRGYLAGGRPLRLVYLAPGGMAYFALEWVHLPEPGETCPLASFVDITPPNAYVPLLASPQPVQIHACGGKLTASPVEPTPFGGFGALPGIQTPAKYLVLTPMMARMAPRLSAIRFPVQLVYRGAVLDGTASTALHWVQVTAGGHSVWLYRPNLRLVP